MGFIWTRCDSCLWLRSHRCSRYSRRLGAVGSRRRSPYLDAIRLFDGALQYFGFGWPPIHQRLQHILNTSCARRTRRRCPSRMHWHAHAPAKCADGAGQRQRMVLSAEAFASPKELGPGSPSFLDADNASLVIANPHQKTIVKGIDRPRRSSRPRVCRHPARFVNVHTYEEVLLDLGTGDHAPRVWRRPKSQPFGAERSSNASTAWAATTVATFRSRRSRPARCAHDSAVPMVG